MAEVTAAASEATRADHAVQATLRLLDELFESFDNPDFAVRLWDGTEWGLDPGRARVTLVLPLPGSLRRFLSTPSEAHLAECYMHGTVDVDGDLEAIIPMGDWLLRRPRTVRERLRLGYHLARLPGLREGARGGNGRAPARLQGREHSRRRDRTAVTYHYDVSNRFYSLWLDRHMAYSCALFARPDEDLDAAQQRKLDYVCRKLRLRPGERLLDIGCGWGGLLRHAGQHYGVEALGITLSRPQAEEANRRLAAAGLASTCRAEVCDYRDLSPSDRFDKVVSIGMVEHVGREQLGTYFGEVWKLLRPGGTFLNHGIADQPGRPVKTRDGFIDTYIFPDGDLPPLPYLLETAEQRGFEIRDVESLREHYALTLRHWGRRLQDRRAEAVDEVGEAVYRTWRLYMAGCDYWFDRGNISVYQALLHKARRGPTGLPLLRSDWYRPPLEG